MKKRFDVVFALFVGLSILLYSCGGPDEEPSPPPPEEAPQAVIEEQELDTIAIQEVSRALITFITGDAYIVDDGDESGGFLADIGGTLGPGQSLEVETGYAELQIGNIGTVRVQEESTVRLDDIVLSSQGSSVDIRVVSGSVLNKVERLAGTDSYEVRTETAVMGVRGTQFGVNVDPEGGTRVAVREGRVAMVPPAADPERVRGRAATSGTAAAAVEAVANSLAERAPVIEANQELSLDRADAAQAEVVAAVMETTITEIEERTAAGETVDVEEVSVRLNTAAEATATSVQEDSQQRRTELTEESREELEQIEEIRNIPIPPPQEESDGDEAGDGEAGEAQAVPVALPVLVPVRLQVAPEGATIMINGRPVAQNRFSGVYQPGEQIQFEMALDGYQTETLNVTVSPDRGRAYQVQLAQVPQRPEPEPEPETVELQISVDQADAQIFIDGRRRGRGTATREFEVGDEVLVRAELDGYDTIEQTVSIVGSMEPVSISLNRTIAGIRVETLPSDATVAINGENRGQGSVTAEFPLGDEVVVTVSREGYESAERSVTVEGTAEAVSFELERLIGTVSISVEPADATILVNGRRVGTGSVSQEFPVGTEINLTIQRDSFAALQVPVTVREGNNSLEYQLSRDLGTLSVTVVPNTARILINGAEVGTGRITQQLPSGQPVTVSVVQDGYVTQERTVDIGTGTIPVRFSMERGVASLSVRAQPSDSTITIDGRSAGTGSAMRNVGIGETVQISASRPGYAPARRSVLVGSEGATVELRLDPRPIEATISAASSSWVRGLVSDGTRVYGSDVNGTVYAVDPAGRVVWQRSTENAGNENSIPVVSNGRVAFSGATELVVVSATNGQVLGRRSLSGSESHLFGRRVASRGNNWFFPSDEAILVLSSDGSRVENRIEVPGGTKMSAGIVGGRVVVADQQGSVVILDAGSGDVVNSLSTGMTQPVALAPAIAGNTAVFVGRRGTAVAVDVSAGSVLWETGLPGGRGSFVDPVIVGQRVLFLDRTDLVALSLADGSPAYTLSGVSGMPAIDGNTVYVPYVDGTLRSVNGSTGRTLRELSLPGAAAGGSVTVGGRIAVGLEDGRVLIIHPAGM